MITWKYKNIQKYMQKNINVKNVKEYVKKVNIYKYIKIMKQHTIETLNQTKKKYIKATNIQKCA